MFERFTERARQVVVLAQDEARGFKHNYIGTEHLLLGLLREEEGVAAQVLDSLHIKVDEVRAEVARIVGEGDVVTSGQVPFTPRAKKVLEVSLREALSLRHNYIGTEHILLGLVRENEGVASKILRDRGYDSDAVRAETLGALQASSGLGRDRSWRMLGRDIDRAQARPQLSQTTLGLTLEEVAEAVSAAQDSAIAAEDLAQAQEATKLRSDLLEVARRVEALRERTPGQE